MSKTTVGFALCGSFCTFSKAIKEMEHLTEAGYDIIPIMSQTAYETDTRFGKAEEIQKNIEAICGKKLFIPLPKPSLSDLKKCAILSQFVHARAIHLPKLQTQ